MKGCISTGTKSSRAGKLCLLHIHSVEHDCFVDGNGNCVDDENGSCGHDDSDSCVDDNGSSTDDSHTVVACSDI